MGHDDGYIHIGREKLHYLRAGQGHRLLIAFPGYGNEAGLFLPFAHYLQKEYTLLSFDLPYHGGSKWTDDTLLKKTDFAAAIKKLMQQEKADKISLLGYSIGGRVCLTIVEQLPEQIDKVLLIAPDGLTFNWFYFFVTQTFVGKRLFRRVLTQPEHFMRITSWLRRRGYINESRYKFAMQYLQSEASRRFLLNVWPGLRELVPNHKRLSAAIEKYGLQMDVFMGRYDRIIPPALAKEFKKDLGTVHLHILEKGHRVFDNENIPQMAECLL